MAEQSEGWYRPLGSRRWHYIVNGRTLCGYWLCSPSANALQQGGTDPDPGDCRICWRRYQTALIRTEIAPSTERKYLR